MRLPSLAAFRARGAWRLVLLPLLFAIAWQSFVVQVHRHVDPATGWSAAGATVAAPASPSNSSPSDVPAKCPVCREVAHAGHAILTSAQLLVAPAQSVFSYVVPRLSAVQVGYRSYTWRSRAPPSEMSRQR